MHNQTDLQHGYALLLERIRFVSEDCTEDLERVRQEGLNNPMPNDTLKQLLERCIDEALRGAHDRGDREVASYLRVGKEQIVRDVMGTRQTSILESSGRETATADPVRRLKLKTHNGINPYPVIPAPLFHGRPVPVREGFVDVEDIRLWGDNERLKIHVAQFTESQGRKPTTSDLLSIMNSQANLPGINFKDQFEIEDLARSIAANGVRLPPVVSHDGILLDGNRRITACLAVLSDETYNADEKKRAKTIRVRQLTEHATDDDKHAVVVSLNFEPDYKVQWPEYVKGRILYEEWRTTLENEQRPGVARRKDLAKKLAAKFAITTDRLNRYIEMIKLSDEFEDHHRMKHGRDAHEVKHHANEYFQYFDELGKGRAAGGVNSILSNDDGFKELVFDLLYDGKFKRFAQIRDLKHAYNNDEAMHLLRSAREEKDRDQGREDVDNGLKVGHLANAVQRRLGGNKRIEVFVKWLREAPVEFFSPGQPDSITEKNLRGLYEALKLVEPHARRQGIEQGREDAQTDS